ncbi:MAG TPA: YceI family protein [Candidatus Angelobacter sp.]|nr:YceI family protein [Candidatus Angelobacter sp.]
MTWTLDPAHSSVTFSAKHMMVTTVRGSMQIRDFDLDLDLDDLTRSSVRVSLDASSIDTGMQQRDAHLRSADFLAVDEHPTIDFVSTRIEPAGDAYRIAGDLTIRGTTRSIVLDAEYAGTVTNMQGGRSAGFSATARIDREEFGLTWNVALEQGGWLVSRDIRIAIDLEVLSAEATSRSTSEEPEAERISA